MGKPTSATTTPRLIEQSKANDFDVTTSIFNLIAFEKACEKAFFKFSRAAQTPALAKALDPEQTGIKIHLNRLKIISKLLHVKAPSLAPTLFPDQIKTSRKKSVVQDIAILEAAINLQEIKTEYYKIILDGVNPQEFEVVPDLINQCLTENNDTTTWLKRTHAQLTPST